MYEEKYRECWNKKTIHFTYISLFLQSISKFDPNKQYLKYVEV